MKSEETKDDPVEQDESRGRPHRVRLPGFINDQAIGLGDVIKRVTDAVGIRPSGDCGCERRAAALNRWLVFSPRPRR
jgi:hypothetical protein